MPDGARGVKDRLNGALPSFALTPICKNRLPSARAVTPPAIEAATFPKCLSAGPTSVTSGNGSRETFAGDRLPPHYANE